MTTRRQFLAASAGLSPPPLPCPAGVRGGTSRQGAALQDFARPVVAAQDALRRQARQPRLRQDGQGGLRHRRDRVRQPVLQGQGEGHGLPRRAEEAGRRPGREDAPDHVRRRREPRRSGRRQADARPSRTTTSGSKRPSTSAATRSASTPRPTASSRSKSSRSWPPTACGGCREFAAPHGLNVIVENHGGLSSNGDVAGRRDEAGRSQELRHAARLRQLPASATARNTTATRASTS